MYGYNYNPTLSDKQKQNKECLICLDDDTLFQVRHYSEFNSDCSCNYYIHKPCLVSWIKKRGVNNAKCLLCSKPIVNANEIADIDTRQTTEYHSRRARVIRLSLNQLLRNEDNIIEIEPTIREEQQLNQQIINTREIDGQHPNNNQLVTLTEVRSSNNTCVILCSIVCMLLIFGFFGALIAHVYVA